MTNEELNTAVLDKMSDEFREFSEWLMCLPRREIFNHAFEYTVKQDILYAMENSTMTDEECRALLSAESPLSDIYGHYCKLETGYMDDIRYSADRVSHMIISREKNAEAQR